MVEHDAAIATFDCHDFLPIFRLKRAQRHQTMAGRAKGGEGVAHSSLERAEARLSKPRTAKNARTLKDRLQQYISAKRRLVLVELPAKARDAGHQTAYVAIEGQIRRPES
jgi:hypothetical protein